MHFKLKENSFFASIAARKLKSSRAAIVFGHTIHLHNISRQQFLNDERLMRHELCHVKQYEENGFFGFLIKYLVESIRYGYTNNRFEVEAREAEASREEPRSQDPRYK